MQNSLDSIIEIRIADPWTVEAWKQVSYEAKEKWHIFKHELGKVHVTQCPHKYNILHREMITIVVKIAEWIVIYGPEVTMYGQNECQLSHTYRDLLNDEKLTLATP